MLLRDKDLRRAGLEPSRRGVKQEVWKRECLERDGAIHLASAAERGVPPGGDRHHHGVEPVGRAVDDLPPILLGDDLELAIAVQEPARRA